MAFKSGKSSHARSAHRREELRRRLPKPVFDLREALQRPEVVHCVMGGVVFALLTAAMLVWSEGNVLVYEGQVAAKSRVSRVGYQEADREATARARDEARKAAPRVYDPNASYLSRLRAGVEGLPKAVQDRDSLDGVSKELIDEYGLTDADVRALQPFAVNEADAARWQEWTNRFFNEQLIRNPVLTGEEYQLYTTTLDKVVQLPASGPASPDGPFRLERIRGEAISIDSESTDGASRLLSRALAAGFLPSELAHVVITPLLRDPNPTLLFNENETTRVATRDAEAVPVVMIDHPRGETIYVSGDRITSTQIEAVRDEIAAYEAQMRSGARWTERLGLLGLAGVVAVMLTVYIAVFYIGIARNPLRLFSLLGLIVGMGLVAAFVAAKTPWLLALVAVGSTVMTAMIVTLAYDRRLALFLSAVQVLLTTALLAQPASMFIVLYAGCAAIVIQLKELRNRSSLVRAAVLSATTFGIGLLVMGVSQVPLVPGAVWQVLGQAGLGFGAALAAGVLMLGILPTLERMFDITTGLTLAELRDPRNPLLRQLQQKAPGTYNHSLQVANIAEAAAESIGANGLLTYVGALYHDIGKMNKPEYFVENQSGGVNKHEKLSPAMSLLVIVGHVKDGVELAREYGLPRAVRHFIESHHGTTLVEYFFHAARSRAEAQGEGEDAVDEIEYRYPGPKPRSREAAILMLTDAVESAARTLAEPSAGSIESLVRRLGRRRLEDGQFNDSELTLRDLTKIENSIIKSLCAIYHGRVAYPGGARADQPETRVEPRAEAKAPAQSA